MSEFITGVLFGLIIGSFIVIFILFNTLPDNVDKVIDNQRDCQIKEYYYMDSHRHFCDRIGVHP